MLRILTRSVSRLLRLAGFAAFVVAVTLLVVFIAYLHNRPDLQAWHQASLDAEFTADSGATDFADYLAAEARVFAQLETQVYAPRPLDDGTGIDRYRRGSLADPARWPQDWNRSFEMPVDDPQTAVLLLHGMSDSPYVLRSLAQSLHDRGAWVLGLRLPGHGTAPSGLKDVKWQDMAAAVRLAMAHLQANAGVQNIYIVGYSTGGALALHYALQGLGRRAQPQPDGIVLISPAIGVTPLAALAVWQARIGDWLGMDKLAWESIKPEYDPFKYNSFAVNAGDQVYRLTAEISRQIDAHQEIGDLHELPPLLAFQSSVDATVSPVALVEGLFARLPVAGHELMLFDINRRAGTAQVLSRDPRAYFDKWLADERLPYGLRVLTNRGPDMVLLDKPAGKAVFSESAVALQWPGNVFSLSHVALPIRKDDPLYGLSGESSPGIHLGDLALRGERGVLQVSAEDMLRLRWNPFYPLLEQHMVEFMGL